MQHRFAPIGLGANQAGSPWTTWQLPHSKPVDISPYLGFWGRVEVEVQIRGGLSSVGVLFRRRDRSLFAIKLLENLSVGTIIPTPSIGNTIDLAGFRDFSKTSSLQTSLSDSTFWNTL